MTALRMSVAPSGTGGIDPAFKAKVSERTCVPPNVSDLFVG